MNVKLIFFIISTSIFILSVIAICCAPIINKVNPELFNNWKSLNCGLFSDLESKENIKLEEFNNYRYIKNLCYRQKSMANLEYASLIISTSLSFICFYLSFLLRLEIGKEFKNKTGLIGFISGIICFILTLVYACYSGYIFNNDIAYGIIDVNGFITTRAIKKLFPNSAIYKWNNKEYISAYEEDGGDYTQFIKYKDLGDKRYNYDSDVFKKYYQDEDTTCVRASSNKPASYILSCEYLFHEHIQQVANKYLYDRWLTTLVLSCFIFILHICLAIFGFLLFKEKKDDLETVNNNSLPKIIQFSTKNDYNENVIKNNNQN